MRSLLAVTFVGFGFFVVACTTFNGLKADGSQDGDAAISGSSSGGSKVTKPVECGTATSKACGGTECKVDTDCASQKCDTGKCTTPIALPASATDGIKNNGETDIDCGGPNAAKCADNKTCATADDCVDGVCSGTCQAPTGTDKVKNGDETDVDCGGTTTGAPKCDAGKTCLAHSDCVSDGCDETKKCAIARSCAQTNGGATCGQGEFEDANHKFESCCTSIPLPSGAKLDKYEITAGRMRQFVTRTNGDVQGWYAANKASLSDKQRATIDPFVDKLPTDMDGDPSAGPGGAIAQVGAFIYLADRPSTEQGCYTGNAGNQAFGAHTYWTTKAQDGDEDRAFDQAFLDRLSLNCVPYPMIAAFCLWDGGRLQTADEADEAYGGGNYPWGNSPVAAGFENTDFAEVGPGAITAGVTLGKTSTGDTTMMNWSNVYQHPQGDSGKPWDLANFIAAPGRFPKDVGPHGHMDVGANLMEWTSSDGRAITGDNGTDPQYGPKKRWSRSGSWEGHQANNPNWQFAVMTKYGKTGGRCARD
jgi:hypothetical protein